MSMLTTGEADGVFIAQIKKEADLWVSPELLKDMLAAQDEFARSMCKFNLLCREPDPDKGIFLLGGDLQLMLGHIKEHDRKALGEYGAKCTELVWRNWTTYGDPSRVTMTFLQGNAYGGGAEAALSSTIVLATPNAAIHFPEWMFGAFPGMGALPILTERCGRREAVRLMCADKDVKAHKEGLEKGLVDIVVDANCDPEGAARIGKKHYETYHGVIDFLRLARIPERPRLNFMQQQEYWVNRMMTLNQKEQARIEHLIRAQRRLDQ